MTILKIVFSTAAFFLLLQLVIPTYRPHVNNVASVEYSALWGDKLREFNVGTFSICAGYNGNLFTSLYGLEIQPTVYIYEGAWCSFSDDSDIELEVTKEEYELFSYSEISINPDSTYTVKLNPKVKKTVSFKYTMDFLTYVTNRFIDEKKAGVNKEKKTLENQSKIISSWGKK